MRSLVLAAACLLGGIAARAEERDPFEAALELARELEPTSDPAPVRAAMARAGAALRTDLARAGSLEARGEALARAVHGEAGLGLAMEEDAGRALALEALLPPRMLERGKGACLGLSLCYLALGRAAGLDAVGVSLPGHFFVRLREGGRAINLETTLGGVVREDGWYREKFSLEAGAPQGNYLRDLSAAEVLAEVLNNAGGALLPRDPARARDLLQRATKLAPEDPDAHYDLALAWRALGKPAEALAAVERSLELWARSREATNLRGLLRLADRPDLAVEDFTRALELEPGEARYWNNRGVARGRLGELEAARGDLTRALALRPGWEEARRNLLLVRLEGERPDEVAAEVEALDRPAREALLAALPGGAEVPLALARATSERWPGTAAAAWLEAAERQLRGRDARAARESCERAFELSGVDRVRAYCVRGLVAEAASDEVWAKRNFVLAMEAGPRDPRGFRYMADHYIRRDRWAVASDYLRGWLERAPADAPDRAQVDALVRQIEASKAREPR